MPTALVILDGLADEPVPSLGGMTPLKAAHTPWLDRLARDGAAGRWQPTPPEREPGSEVGIFSCLGQAVPHVGRAALEALGRGVEVGPGERVFRVSGVTLSGPADAPETVLLGEAPVDARRFAALAEGMPQYKVCADDRGRHLLVLPDGPGDGMMPPHQVTGLPLFAAGTLPSGVSWRTMRNRLGTDLWPWGGGPVPALGDALCGWTLVGAVDLVRGIGRCLGMDVADVAGATGDVDTGLGAKARAAMDVLAGARNVAIHVEGADMAAHRREPDAKRALIERADRELIGPLLELGVRLAVTCDHGTSSASGRHLAGPVPFAVSDAGAGNEFCDMAESPVWDAARWKQLLTETPVRC